MKVTKLASLVPFSIKKGGMKEVRGNVIQEAMDCPQVR
jgi:hypothetical protein